MIQVVRTSKGAASVTPSGHRKAAVRSVARDNHTNAHVWSSGSEGFQYNRTPHIFATDTSVTDAISGNQTPQNPVETSFRKQRRMRPIRRPKIAAGALASSMPLATFDRKFPKPSSLCMCELMKFRAGYCATTLAIARPMPTPRHTLATRRLSRGTAAAIKDATMLITATDPLSRRACFVMCSDW